ncbi:MAG: polysaccharide export protein EpsE, partial [Bacteroidetes bacterium]|nr:polysaccharide export protein EpsE [Bacteroidota bacterium]
RVIPLNNPNTTVFEALAMSGGISQFGKARNIKLIRGDLKNPKIFKINLATIKGVKEANLILQANDIIYVEPSLRLSQSIWGELTPIVGILTNIVFIWSFLTLK